MAISLSRQLARAEDIVEVLSPAEALRRQREAPLTFVDVREKQELGEAGVIASAVHAPRSLLEWHLDPGSDQYLPVFSEAGTFVFYCGGGGRSLLSALTAFEMGLASVASIGGGFRGWVAAGNPIVPFVPGR